MTTTEKPLINISIIGHVDSGKSTLCGQIGVGLGSVDKRSQEKLQKVAAENGKDSFSLAYFTDRTEQERKRGVTINTTLVQMQTVKFRINFLDCPGHADYIKNASSGCKQSDLSIVVVPASFQASCSADGTLKIHLTLAAFLGSKNFIVCINKLDEVAAQNNADLETTFEAAKAAVGKLLKKIGVKPETVFFLPISALKGIGLFKNGENFPFFKGIVPKIKKPGFDKITCLEEAIDYQDAPARPVDKPLRMPISSIAHVPGHGAIFCGRIDYGTIKKGDQVKFLPVNLKAEVKNVQEHKKDLAIAQAGTNIGFNIITKDKLAADKIAAGHMVGPADDADFQLYPFYVISGISLKGKSKIAQEGKGGMKVGYSPILSCGTSNIACKFLKLFTTTKNPETGEEEREDIPFITKDQKFSALVYPTKQALYETSTDFPALGKLVCRDSGTLVIVGHIVDRVTEERAAKEFGIKMSDAMGVKPSAATTSKKDKK